MVIHEDRFNGAAEEVETGGGRRAIAQEIVVSACVRQNDTALEAGDHGVGPVAVTVVESC